MCQPAHASQAHQPVVPGVFEARQDLVQGALLMAEFGDVVLYGSNLAAMFVQTDDGGMTAWSNVGSGGILRARGNLILGFCS